MIQPFAAANVFCICGSFLKHNAKGQSKNSALKCLLNLRSNLKDDPKNQKCAADNAEGGEHG